MDNFVSTFADYDDLAIQFGFITIFAAAFPLAPFLAYIANTIEMCAARSLSTTAAHWRGCFDWF
jgi:hypothetical protein